MRSQGAFIFRLVLTTNTNYFPERHQSTGIYNSHASFCVG